MACNGSTDLQQMESLVEDRQKCSAPQPGNNCNGVTEAQSSHKTWDKPVKLKLAFLQGGVLHHSAKRELFTSGKNGMKEIKNRAAARKTLSQLPRHRPTSTAKRLSGSYKVPCAKQNIMVNRSKPNVGQGQHPKMYQRKTQGPFIPGSNRSMQKISASSTKKEGNEIPAVRSENQSSSVMAPPSRPVKIGGKVMRHVPHLANLENSVNLLNVDDVEEKLVKESSLLKSQILKQLHENTKRASSCNVKNKQKGCNDQIAINEMLKSVDEKLKQVDEKQEKILSELANLAEVVKNVFSNQELVCRNCHCHNTHKAVIKSSDSITTNNSGHQATSGDQHFVCPETNSVPGSEIKPCSVRRSLRLQTKGAQNAYESLRKSTKLLSTPRPCSTKKNNTPGRISRKVISQLNDLYND